MSLISHRSCHIVGMNDEALNQFVEEMNSFLVENEVPDSYSVNIYKDQVTCCGHMPIGVAVEIQGPKHQAIRELDEMLLGKVKEICGRNHIDYHKCEPVEIIQNINGTFFFQG